MKLKNAKKRQFFSGTIFTVTVDSGQWTVDLSPPGILPKMPKTSVFGLPRCHFTFALHGDRFVKNWWVETYPNTIKLSKYAIKTVLENDRRIRNFGNIPKTEGKSARWVSQAFSGTKEKTQKLSKNKAYFSYVKFQLLSTQVMMKIRKKKRYKFAYNHMKTEVEAFLHA